MPEIQPEPQSEDKILRRRAHFMMIDGSPSFSEWQYPGESLENFVLRIAVEVNTGGGYVSLAGVELHEISQDPNTETLINQSIEANKA